MLYRRMKNVRHSRSRDTLDRVDQAAGQRGEVDRKLPGEVG